MSSYTRTIRPGASKAGTWIGFGLIVLIAIVIGGFFLVRHLYRTSVLKPFESSLQEYIALQDATKKEPTNKPCQGGVIAIDAGTGTLDHFYFDLPDDLKASDPAAVKTVAFLHWRKDVIDHYTGNKPAYQHKCDVQLVDRASKTLLLKQHFEGSPPPMSISSRSSSGEGSKPTDAIVLFIKTNKR